MDKRIKRLLSELRVELDSLYGDRFKGVYLYGSYARNEEDAESDVDILIVLDRVDSYSEEITQSSTGLNNLSIGELNILFAHGESFTGLLIARRAYRVLLAKVDDFVTKFPLVYGKVTDEPPSTPLSGDEIKELIRVSFET